VVERAPQDIGRWLKRRRIGVLMGGQSAERSISLKTGNAILQSLRRQGFKAVPVDASPRLPFDLKRKKINFAYLALHGSGGEDGTVQGLLETLKIPYTGSGVLASALAMDKISSKRLFDSSGLMNAAWFDVRSPAPEDVAVRVRKLGYPVVVKPARQGSAIGVSIVKQPKSLRGALREAFRYDTDVIVEKFISGPEITVGVLGPQTLPIIEIIPTNRSFYDFQAKYAPGGSRHLLPARISAKVAERANHLAREACRLLAIRGVARVDMIVGPGEKPYLLEVNTIPGMTETSLLPDAAAAAGISFDALVLKIAEYSVEAA
jgi:D-alanine-D-alanine ligase